MAARRAAKGHRRNFGSGSHRQYSMLDLFLSWCRPIPGRSPEAVGEKGRLYRQVTKHFYRQGSGSLFWKARPKHNADSRIETFARWNSIP